MHNSEITPKVNIGERISYPLSNDDSAYVNMISSDDAMLKMAMKFYHQSISSNVRATQYIEERGIFNSEVISHFNLGFSDRTLGLQLQKLSEGQEEISRGTLQRLGLFKSSGHELFYGAITFPIANQGGDIVGCYGRRVTPKLGARSRYYVHWKTQGVGFFNIQALETNEQLIFCKNPIDALSWWVHGFAHVISTIGSSDFNEQHAKLLKDNSIKTIYLAMGTTKNTLIEARRIAKLLKKKRIAVMLVLYPNGFDANSFITQEINPKDELQQLLNSSHRYMVN